MSQLHYTIILKIVEVKNLQMTFQTLDSENLSLMIL